MWRHICLVFFFFFFKQKTAYDMRISDWSSDVCSSDLGEADLARQGEARIERLPRPLLEQQRARHALQEGGAVRRRADSRRLPCGQIGRASCRERVCQYV